MSTLPICVFPKNSEDWIDRSESGKPKEGVYAGTRRGANGKGGGGNLLF